MERLNIVQINRVDGKFFIQNLSTETVSWMTDSELVNPNSNVRTMEECICIMYKAVDAPIEGEDKPELRISKNAERAINIALDART